MYLVKWEVVCLPREEGGLGIKDIPKFNEALLGKWIWALATDQQQLWVRIINSKYGGWNQFQMGRDKRGSSYWWRDLRKIYHQPEHSIFHQNMAWSVGGGKYTRFERSFKPMLISYG